MDHDNTQQFENGSWNHLQRNDWLMTAEEIVNSWPSTSRLIQLNTEFRPAIKCKDPDHGNPVSCDDDDINQTNGSPLPKDENGFLPVKIIEGGPDASAPSPPPEK